MPRRIDGVSSQTLGDLPVEVDYSYYAGERMTYHHPGCPAEVEIISVRFSIDTESGEIPVDCISDATRTKWEERIEEEVDNALCDGPEEDDVRDYDYPEEL